MTTLMLGQYVASRYWHLRRISAYTTVIFGVWLFAGRHFSLFCTIILYERVSAVAPLPQRVWGQLANNHTPIHLIPKV